MSAPCCPPGRIGRPSPAGQAAGVLGFCRYRAPAAGRRPEVLGSAPVAGSGAAAPIVDGPARGCDYDRGRSRTTWGAKQPVGRPVEAPPGAAAVCRREYLGAQRMIRAPVVLVILALGLAACRPPTAPPASSSAPLVAASPRPAAVQDPSASAAGRAASRSPAEPSASTARRQPLAPGVPVRYGELGQASDAGYYIALARGYFADEGLDVQPIAIGSGGRMIPSLGAGQIDVGGGGISTSLINALVRDVPLRLVADKGSLRPGFGYSGLIVRKELVDRGTVQGLADLRGRRIAVNTATGMDIVGLNASLERGGLKLEDVTLEEIAYPDMIAALANGAVDGATPLEPTVTAILQQGVGVQLIGFDEATPNSQLGAIMYAPQFMRDQPAAARRFALAYLRGIRDYNQAFTTGAGRDDVIQILTKATTIKDPHVFEMMTLPGLNPNGYLNTESIVATQAFWQRLGLLQATVEPEQLVDHGYMDYALGVLGRLP